MGRYQLNDLLLILRDLLGDKLALWSVTRCAETYRSLLGASLASIEGLPPILTLPVDARAFDRVHDQRGRAISQLIDALLEHDQTPEALREVLRRLRAAFVPNRSELNDAYADEAAHAIQRQPLLAEYEAELRSIPVLGGVTLYDWVKGFLDQGVLLDRKIRKQAESQLPGETREGALVILNEAIGRLGRFRIALTDEVDSNPALPRNLVAQVFSYADELKQRRDHEAKKPKAAEEAGAP